MPLLLFIALLPILGHLNFEQHASPVLGKTLARAIFWSVFVALLLLPFVTSLRHQARRRAIIREIMERGEAAAAVITRIEQTGRRTSDGVDEKWRVELGLEVTRSSGESYQARTDCYISTVHLPQYQPGKAVQVKMAPGNREEVVVVGLE
jgi:hypothetical protein